jgi:hypothetical protein
VDAYREAVTQHFPQGSPVRVQLRKYMGEPVMEIRLIPVAQADRLIEALMDTVGGSPISGAPSGAPPKRWAAP